MKSRVICFTLSFFILVSLILVSCARTVAKTTSTTSTPATTSSTISTSLATPSPTSPSTTANWWDKFGTPQYGGTIVVRSGPVDFSRWDPADPRGGAYNCIIDDTLFRYDLTKDPSVQPYKGEWVPLASYRGQLAESWEHPDPLTVIVHLRKGVYWQNRPPVNGREFTAYDVQYNFDRLLGTGSGFTTPNPFLSQEYYNVERAVAVDKYTVQFTLKVASYMSVLQVITAGSGGSTFGMAAPEWAKLYGTNFSQVSASPPGGGPPPGGGEANAVGSESWKTATGNGPWMITDVVQGTSATFSENTNYYGYDEMHPSNKLPYIDQVKYLLIPDNSTALAAIRTGKIDLMLDPFMTPTWRDMQLLAKTNPQIVQAKIPSGSSVTLTFRTTVKPFNDIRVREAMNMAIDRQGMAKSLYGGTVDGIPSPSGDPRNKGWVTPYDQWPADLQSIYSYNPTKAKQLLADAGYPNGFQTDCLTTAAQDMTPLEAVQAYLKNIGINMEIQTMDQVTFADAQRAGKYDQLVGGGGGGGFGGPWQGIVNEASFSPTADPYNRDPKLDGLAKQIMASTDLKTMQKLVDEANLYVDSLCWSISTFPTNAYLLWQPWIKGYNGQAVMSNEGFFYARMWVDQSSK